MTPDCMKLFEDICDTWNDGAPKSKQIWCGWDSAAGGYQILEPHTWKVLLHYDDFRTESWYLRDKDDLRASVIRDLNNYFEKEENNMPTKKHDNGSYVAINPVSGKVTVNIAFDDWWNKYINNINYISYPNKVKQTESKIKKVIFNAPATIILWKDGTKTVVKCGENETYDPEKGLAMALAKHYLGDHGRYYNLFKKYLPEKTFTRVEVKE